MKCTNCGKLLTKDQIRRIKNYSRLDYGFCSRVCSGAFARGLKKNVSKTDEERFLEKINKTDSCWEWVGAKLPKGYGRFGYFKMERGHITCYAHRYAYELFKGEIPNDMTIDHTCKNTSCVNPDHLEVVSLYENLMRSNSPSANAKRQTHCKNGHPFNEENTRYWKNKRICRVCDRINHKKRKPKSS